MRVDLRKRYQAEIKSLIPNQEEFFKQADLGFDESGELGYHLYIDSQLNLFPSGKIYAFWTSNQSVRDVIKDSLYTEILEEELEKEGLSLNISSGDVFFSVWVGDDYISTSGDERFYQYGELIAESEHDLVKYMMQENHRPEVVTIFSESGNVWLYDYSFTYTVYGPQIKEQLEKEGQQQ